VRRINLLPPEIGKRRRARRATSVFVVAVFAYVGLLGVWWLVGTGRLRNAEDDLVVAKERADRAQAAVSQLQEFANLRSVVETKERTLATAMADDIHWSRLLVEFSMVVPNDSWLTAFSGTATAPAPAAPPAGAPATPAPTAPAAPAAPAKLGSLTFAGVTFDFPGVATWITRLSGDKSLQTIWVPNATKSQIGAREVVNFSSTGDLTPAAASNRYQQPTGATP
jgi:Tfp pilus assembly protein PilN